MALSAHSVLTPVPPPPSAPICRLDGEPVLACDFPSCGLCKRIRRIAGACDGKRTLAEVAAQLDSDLDRCLRYGQQGMQGGWLLATQPPPNALTPPLPKSMQATKYREQGSATAATTPLAHLPLEQLRQEVVAGLGRKRAKALWEDAGHMVRGEHAGDWLVALQLCAADEEETLLTRLADKLGL